MSVGAYFWMLCAILKVNYGNLGYNNFENDGASDFAYDVIDQGEKIISTLYRRRYMSNEQMYKLKGIQYRGYDIVGYPVAIYSEKMT